MNRKKWITVLCLLLCAVLILPLAGCEGKSAPKPIEFPVEGFTWGMTLEEAQQVIDAAGVTPRVRESYNEISWSFQTEDLKKLGMNEFLDMSFFDQYNAPMRMHFFLKEDGSARLAQMTVDVTTPNNEEMATASLTEIFTAQYGELPEGRKLWGTYGATLTEKQCENLSPITLSIVERESFGLHVVYPAVSYEILTTREGCAARLYYMGAYYTEYLYGA